MPEAKRDSSPGAGRLREITLGVGQSVRDMISNAAKTSPARLALLVFTAVIVAACLLLLLPVASADNQSAPIADAWFTAVSAVTVTGLVTVPTATYWSMFGQVVILVGIKVGGLGVMTLASLLGLAVSRHMGLAQRVITAQETKAERLGEAAGILRVIVIATTSAELLTAAFIVPRLLIRGQSLAEALWHGIFYGVSAFNNAGFIPEVQTAQYVGDPWVSIPIAVSVFAGSLGFPVFLVLFKHLTNPKKWTLHVKIVLSTTTILLAVTFVCFALMEWNNPDTLGEHGVGTKILASFFAAVMPRSGGFTTLDVSLMNEDTWLIFDAMMFVGGGPGSTAGGIKVTTFALLILAIVAEARGDVDIEVFHRRIAAGTVRQAVAVLFVGATLVLLGNVALLELTDFDLDRVLFEVLSAYATAGLSTGITSALPDSAKYVLSFLMYIGRLGTMTLGAALVLRERRRIVRLPEDRPIVG